MEPLLHDLKHALRALRLRPGFSAVVILTLALGIGANTAIFSAVSALLLRPLPFADAHQLVRITSLRGGVEGGLSVPEQDDLAALGDVVADIALYTDQGMYNASGFGDPEELPATITTHNLFRVLGVEPMIGAMYPAETDRTRRFELVISHGLWTRRFGQDPHIVGRTMTLDGAPGYTIHGVLPAGLNFPSSADLFRSSGISADPASYRRRDLRGRVGLARLQPGVTIEQARDRISALGRRLEREFPATNAGQQFQVTALRDIYVGNVRAYVLLLFGAVALVLVVACSNVANLFLSRLLARERELAVRLALGASRARVMRQMLVESLVLALAGGAAGLACAWLGIELITRMVRAQLPPWMTIELDASDAGIPGRRVTPDGTGDRTGPGAPWQRQPGAHRPQRCGSRVVGQRPAAAPATRARRRRSGAGDRPAGRGHADGAQLRAPSAGGPGLRQGQPVDVSGGARLARVRLARQSDRVP